MSPSRGHREGPHRRNVCPRRARAAVQGAEVVVTATPRMKTRGGRTAGGLLSPELAGGRGVPRDCWEGTLAPGLEAGCQSGTGVGGGGQGKRRKSPAQSEPCRRRRFCRDDEAGAHGGPVSHPCHPSPRCLPPDGPALGRPVPLSREGRERTAEHTSHDFCLEATHIALAHCPSAFVFGQVGTHNPPAE